MFKFFPDRLRRGGRIGLLALLVALPVLAGPPVATVNGEPIPPQALKRKVDHFMASGNLNAAGGIFNPNVYAKARREQLDELIDQELLWQEARRQDLLPTEGQVIEAVERERAEYPNRQSFIVSLESRGLTQEQFQQETRRRLAGAFLLRQEVYAKIRISDQEVKDFYRDHEDDLRGEERLRLRQVLLALPREADAETLRAAQAQAQAVLQRIRSGEDFAALAREVSDGANAGRGGDMGLITRQQLPLALQGPLARVEVGEIKGPLRSRQGFHVIRVESREPGALPPLDEAREPIRNYLARQRGEQLIEEYVAGLREQADIQVNLQ